MSLAFLLPLSYFFRINPWQSDYTKYMIISKALEKYSQVVLQRGCIFVLQLLKLHTNVLKLCYFGRGKKYFMAASGCFWRRQWHPTPVLLPGKPLDGGAWWAAVHGVAQSRTRLKRLSSSSSSSGGCFFASLYIILEAKVVLWGCCQLHFI